MAGIPLLGADYFSKPEPAGSVSSTVARLMAQAGAVLSDRVEKQSQLAEAKLKAPAITSAIGGAYSKISHGDFSGFEDLIAAHGMSTGNPLLSGLAKEANDLGVHLANNYTQQSILTDRLRVQKEGQDQRDAQARSMQEDRQAEARSMQEDRQFESESAAVHKENEKRQKQNEIAVANAKAESDVTGKPIQPPVLEMLPMPTKSRTAGLGSGPGPGANAMGLPEGAIEGPLPSSDPAPTRAAAPPDQVARVKPTDQPISLTPDQEKEFMTGMNAQEKADYMKSKGLVAETPISTKVQLGDMTIDVGKGKTKEAKMEITGVDTAMGSTGPSKTIHQRVSKANEENIKARETFIDSIGTMHVDPTASNFIVENWGTGKDPKIGFEQVKDNKGKVEAIRMYGTGPDGKKRIAFDNGADKNEVKYTDEVSKDFYDAYKSMLSVKERVNDEYGIKLSKAEKPQQPETMTAWERVSDPEIKSVAEQARSEVKAAESEFGKKSPQVDAAIAKGQKMVLSAQNKKKENVLVDEKYGKIEDLNKAVAKEDAGPKEAKRKSELKDLRDQLKSIETELDKGGKEVVSQGGGVWGGSAHTSIVPFSAKEKRDLVIRRSNVLKKISERE